MVLPVILYAPQPVVFSAATVYVYCVPLAAVLSTKLVSVVELPNFANSPEAVFL